MDIISRRDNEIYLNINSRIKKCISKKKIVKGKDEKTRLWNNKPRRNKAVFRRNMKKYI